MTSFSRGKRLLTKLLLILFGIAAGALIAEVALRITGYSYPEFYQLDQSRGYALRPGMEGRYRKEGESYVRINSEGLRDREHQKSKPSDTIRIAVLGDSYAEALQVSQEQTFWSVLEKQLSSCSDFAGKKVEVINFGVSGYGTAQELITLREHVWDYSPDIVLFTVTTNNDITDNSRALKKTDEVPYFVYRDGTLVLDDSFKNSRPFLLHQTLINRLGRWFKDHSRLVQAVNEGHHGFKILLASWKSRWKASAQNAVALGMGDDKAIRAEELGIDNLIYFTPTDPVWKDAWNVTEGLIKETSDEVKSHGARFIVVTMSNPPQVFPSQRSREAYMKRIGVTDLLYPDNRIKAFCDRMGISTIILAPELQSYADRQHVLLHGFGADIGNGHWNATGHRVAGEVMARMLCASSMSSVSPWR
jgi:hypothetical protein